MVEQKAWCITDAGHRLRMGTLGTGVDTRLDVARDEPSHIHIPRPSRRLRPDAEPTTEPRPPLLALTA